MEQGSHDYISGRLWELYQDFEIEECAALFTKKWKREPKYWYIETWIFIGPIEEEWVMEKRAEWI